MLNMDHVSICFSCGETVQSISPYNTRLFKQEDPSTSLPVYEVRLASTLSQGMS